MRIADLYIRVSTDEQADKGYSQRLQEDVLLKYCEINTIKVRKIIFEDHSAKTFERPEWKNLLRELKKSKGKTDLVLFTKWDRFSRNASDAYQMISTLRKIGVEPQAIEQPLDMNVPENKMMLAVYLTTPEIENDRRALNVKHGMRQARKEGRWLGVAPPGYINRTRENGTKYVAIDEPEASHMRWAFEQIAEGVFTTQEIWKMAVHRGLKCSATSFRTALRNVGYCGKVLVAAYKNEDEQMVQGLHEPLISEALFYKAQEVMDGRVRDIGINSSHGVLVVTPDKLPLRGFLNCNRCTRLLTGSASKGRNNYYHYYHCQPSCGVRYKAEPVNMAFVDKLREFIPKPGMAELYTEVILDLYQGGTGYLRNERKKFITEITENNNRITKARELLLTDDISGSDYKLIKSEAEEKIARLEVKLNDFLANSAATIDIDKVVYKAIENLKKLDLLYLNADIRRQRDMIGSIFTEKWSFDGQVHRTRKVNEAAQLIYLINSKLGNKKSRVRTKIRSDHGFVPSAGVEPARFPTGV
ncbi:recombinase family protein [Pedobacter petrophilus]|uniref:Recombinase family protein n=1 Tax=Pedobacter petrophilus TaxID=1908241 RepID=A0A7K0G1R3_9SPHI|nr:recombinase family protein [Pedobacter petrophilus]MRX77768.1 recombinase family protein [Pedobacter petrophilus]